MKKIYAKVFIAAVALLLSAVMILSVSYAWLVISKSPAVNGISVMIGGGKTILLAADITQTITDEAGNTTVIHYPGKFSETLELSGLEGYAALEDSGALSPVSTTDGLHWIIPRYSENGELLDVKQFAVDNKLDYANGSNGGGYICLDFWIVSPGSEYDVRVSMDKQTGEGSSLVEIPGVTRDEAGNFILEKSQNIIAASARVGFLVSTEKAGDAALSAYLASSGYDERYSVLLGTYQESGQTPPAGSTRFTIYEPNGTLHAGEARGQYLVTNPLCYDAEQELIREADISDRLAVQTESPWRTVQPASEPEEAGQSGEEGETGVEKLLLEEILTTALVGKDGLSLGAAQDTFLAYLKGQTGAYLTAGRFFRNTAVLYNAAHASGDLTSLETAGAADSAVITRLERNAPQRVRMYIWLEGQDADCRNESLVSSSQIALQIELAGAAP